MRYSVNFYNHGCAELPYEYSHTEEFKGRKDALAAGNNTKHWHATVVDTKTGQTILKVTKNQLKVREAA